MMYLHRHDTTELQCTMPCAGRKKHSQVRSSLALHRWMA